MLEDFRLFSPRISVKCACVPQDAQIRTQAAQNTLSVYLTAKDSKPCFVDFQWDANIDPTLLLLGDAWERSYGDLGFVTVKENDRAIPWYFMLTDKENCVCFGVKTQPHAFISFRVTETGVAALADCRNGAEGVALNGRELPLCTFVYRRYDNTDPFDALCDFCKLLCPDPILPAFPVYGGNDWYNAYGNNSFATVKAAAEIHSECAAGIPNLPFMVIDDGWEQGDTCGPWLPNEKFKDMRAMCDQIKSLGLRAGIWIRPLQTKDPGVREDMLINRCGQREYMDPSHPAVQALIKGDITRIRDWGFQLLKYDYSTYDLIGDWGKDLTDTSTNVENWHFYDPSKTTAEIILDLYRLIRTAADGMLLIGCNTVSHLCAGLVEINRTGDDTSGKDWLRTRKMGVNTLAFRLAQNRAFYLVDADCVGMPVNFIPWEKNRQWMHLLALSGTAIFISCDEVTQEQKEEIAAAYRAAQQPHTIRPIDWLETKTPAIWDIDGERTVFNWD